MLFEHPTKMFGKIVISSILIIFISCRTAYGRYGSRVTFEENVCTSSGYMCANCTTSVFCVPNPDGTFLPEYIKCDEGQSCFESFGKCAYGVNKECPAATEFKCHQHGVFPDPLYCDKYHVCATADAVAEEYSCGPDWMYSAKTRRCSEPYTGDNCPQPVIFCYQDMEKGKVKGDPSMFYVCQRRTDEEGRPYLYPDLFYCDNGNVFDGTECVDPTPDSGLDSNGRCKKIGYFYHPSDCTKYRQCTLPGAIPITLSCLIGYKFDPTTHVCHLFDCNDCE